MNVWVREFVLHVVLACLCMYMWICSCVYERVGERGRVPVPVLVYMGTYMFLVAYVYNL